LRGYLIHLTREYTDGGMDSHAEQEKGVAQGKLAVTVIRHIKFIFRNRLLLLTETRIVS
jgi:hypothetical protein